MYTLLSEFAMRFTDCTFAWESQPVLTNISLDVKHGELVAVIGVVGSGKSCLMSSLLGDTRKLFGDVSISVSYKICFIVILKLVLTLYLKVQ
jgi:ABC-type transporter Mla maintaining outer membrane lipid asymmetry ATPase subunit MlaF